MLTPLLALGLWVALAPDAKDEELFDREVHPILAAECYGCHGPEAAPPKGTLRLDTAEGILKGGRRGAAIVPGRPDESLLLRAVERRDEDLQMPPKRALSAAQIEVLRDWIARGAPGRRGESPAAPKPGGNDAAAAVRHWAFVSPRRRVTPVPSSPGWTRSDIDAFVLERLDAAGLAPSPEADRRTLLRRASFDLLGLPPTLEEVEEFCADTAPDAFERLLDRLLASPRHGERWGRHWLDVARYADTKGYVYSDREDRRFVHAPIYRDWVIGAINRDLPYDRFLLEQIAADRLLEEEGAAGDPSSLAAMGFLTLGQRFLGVVHDIIDDRLDVIFRGTQGLSIGCARCHDHKYDPIPMAEYYGLYGVFASSEERFAPVPEPDPPGEELRRAYIDELAKREAKLEEALEAKRTELSSRLRRQVEAYLLQVLDVERLPTEEFYSFVSKDDVNPFMVRRWSAWLLERAQSWDPVFGPWSRLAAVRPSDFERTAPLVLGELLVAQAGGAGMARANALVVRALAGDPLARGAPGGEAPAPDGLSATAPTSFREVAARYGRLLAGVEAHWQAALAAAKAAGLPPPTSLDDPDEEEVRAALHAPDSPTTVPRLPISELEWYFDEGTRVELAKLHAQIETWNIDAPGAAPLSTILVDRARAVRPRIFLRGDPRQPGPEVPRRFLAALSPPGAGEFREGSGRLELARAIASPSNPLTARVIVNRLWAHHFGAGLVERPSELGVRAEPPTHPGILDGLALDLVADGWSLKRLHRRMMLASAYRQESAGQPAPALDPENRLLWRKTRARLDFEALRDAILDGSGRLDLRMGGRSVDLFARPHSMRRTVYGFVDRQFFPSVLRIFDVASPDQHSPGRFATTVPQQALFLLNDPFMAEAARGLAARTATSVSAARGERGIGGGVEDPGARIAAMVRALFQREPTASELALGQAAMVAWEAGARASPRVDPHAADWSYGWAPVDPEKRAAGPFTPLPHFTGSSWQGGPAWPDGGLGWARLTADGGHPGNDLGHAVVRRWTAPRSGSVEVQGVLEHPAAEGEGVRGWVFARRAGLLGVWEVQHSRADTKIAPLEVVAGETVDFVVDVRAALGHDDFSWSPRVRLVDGGVSEEWDARRDFQGASEPPLAPWELYAQTLLLSNELSFVD